MKPAQVAPVTDAPQIAIAADEIPTAPPGCWSSPRQSSEAARYCPPIAFFVSATTSFGVA